MIKYLLKRRAARVKGVDATLFVKIKNRGFVVRFGEGDDENADAIVFDSYGDFVRGKPSRMSGTGKGLLAFKEAMGA